MTIVVNTISTDSTLQQVTEQEITPPVELLCTSVGSIELKGRKRGIEIHSRFRVFERDFCSGISADSTQNG